tara:strand:- start:1534 stop:1959 length:426 start_codon:yes stop_codon:yes gene_type:complete
MEKVVIDKGNFRGSILTVVLDDQIPVKYRANPEYVEPVLMEWDEYLAFKTQWERDAFLGPAVASNEERFDYALNVLPPMRWRTNDGIESFCIAEFYSGTMTTQHAKANGMFISKPVDLADPSTLITRDDFEQVIAASGGNS